MVFFLTHTNICTSVCLLQSQKKKKKESVDQSNGVAPVPGRVANGQTLQTSGGVNEVDAGIGVCIACALGISICVCVIG